MATIERSADCPEGQITFYVGEAEFALSDDTKTYETDDTSVIEWARENPFLSVAAVPAEKTSPQTVPTPPSPATSETPPVLTPSAPTTGTGN